MDDFNLLLKFLVSFPDWRFADLQLLPTCLAILDIDEIVGDSPSHRNEVLHAMAFALDASSRVHGCGLVIGLSDTSDEDEAMEYIQTHQFNRRFHAKTGNEAETFNLMPGLALFGDLYSYEC